jgi:hypothetical protein
MKMLSLLALFCPLASAQSLEIVHITDTHVMQIEGIHPALLPLRQANIHSATQLEKFLRERRASPPAFFLHTGDILEALRYDSESGPPLNGQIERFQSIHRLSPAPMYLTLGNRDLAWYRQDGGKQVVVRDAAMVTEARAAWRRAFDCFRNGTWYSFEKRAGATAYLLAVLDNGVTNDPEFVQSQLAWLRKLVAESKSAALVIAVHIPLSENVFGESVKEILKSFDGPVLVLAGHRHTDGVEEISLSPRRVQVRTASFTGGKLSSRRVVLRPAGIDIYSTNEPEKLLFTMPVGDSR